MEDDEIEKMDCFMECTIDDDKYSAGDAGFGREVSALEQQNFVLILY